MTGDQPNTEASRTTEPITHTPGPWHVEPHRDDCLWVAVPAPVGRKVIAVLCIGFDEPWDSQQHANARLIAAAPDLLEALKAAQRDLETVEREMQGIAPEAVSPALPIIRAAIAKAEGR